MQDSQCCVLWPAIEFLKRNDDVRLPDLVSCPVDGYVLKPVFPGIFHVVGVPHPANTVQGGQLIPERFVYVLDLMMQNKHLDHHTRCEQADTGAQAFELLLGIFNDDGGTLHVINHVRCLTKRLHLRSDIEQLLCHVSFPFKFFLNGLKQKGKNWIMVVLA